MQKLRHSKKVKVEQTDFVMTSDCIDFIKLIWREIRWKSFNKGVHKKKFLASLERQNQEN